MIPEVMMPVVNHSTIFVLILGGLIGILVAWFNQKRNKRSLDDRRDRPRENSSAAFLTPPSLCLVSAPSASDPRIRIEFGDERRNRIRKKTALILVNTGAREALDVQIETIHLRGQEIRFPHVADAIASQGRERFDPETCGRWGTVNTALFVDRLVKEWNRYNNTEMAELHIPIKVTYQNLSGTASFETTCILVFIPRTRFSSSPKRMENCPYSFATTSIKRLSSSTRQPGVEDLT